MNGDGHGLAHSARQERRRSERRANLVILTVDDSPTDALLLQHELHVALQAGLEVVCKYTLAEGLAYLRTHHVDAVLFDLTLPDGDPTDPRVLEEATSHAPVILVTGNDDEARLHELIGKGAHDWLHKSRICAEELRRTIRGAITRNRLAQENVEALERARRAEDDLRVVIETSTDAVLIVGGSGQIFFANCGVEPLFGRTLEELMAESFGMPVVAGDWSEIDIRRPDGTSAVAEMRVTEIRWNGRPALHISLHDTTERHNREQELHRLLAEKEALARELEKTSARHAQQAMTDPLTGALNRRGLLRAAAQEIERCRRYGHSLALILFDLDHFKQINDRCGHEAGDKVLQETAHAISAIIRQTDSFARYGGEEFAVLTPGVKLAGARAIAEKMRQQLAGAVESEAGALPVSASFGVALLKNAEDFESLMRRTDRMLYQAKALGRDRVEVDAGESEDDATV